MPKVYRQYLLFETINVHDGKVRTLLIPNHDIRVGVVLNKTEATSKISKVLAIKMEGPFIFSLLHLPLRRSSLQSFGRPLLVDFFYSSYISKVRLNIF